MDLSLEKFKVFINLADEGPDITDFPDLDKKLAEFLAGNLPEISDEELLFIHNFMPKDLSNSIVSSVKEAREEIEENCVRISNREQLGRYLISLAEKLERCVKSLKFNSRAILNTVSTIGLTFEEKETAEIWEDFLDDVNHFYEGSEFLLNFVTDTISKYELSLTYKGSSQNDPLAHSQISHTNFLSSDSISEVTSQVQVQVQNEPKYLISKGKIVDLYEVLIKEVIKSIECPEFMMCFDLNNLPNVYPKYKYQQGMAYALKVLDSNNQINEQIALSHFGIKNYYNYKNNILPIGRHEVKRSIDKVLKGG